MPAMAAVAAMQSRWMMVTGAFRGGSWSLESPSQVDRPTPRGEGIRPNKPVQDKAWSNTLVGGGTKPFIWKPPQCPHWVQRQISLTWP